ncbi:MAG: hypothetical protein ACLP0J_10715 [Solirubrobacteraceae bacterium]
MADQRLLDLSKRSLPLRRRWRSGLAGRWTLAGGSYRCIAGYRAVQLLQTLGLLCVRAQIARTPAITAGVEGMPDRAKRVTPLAA